MSTLFIFVVGSLGLPPSKAVFAETPISNAIQDVKTTVYDVLDKTTVTLNFETGSAVVSESERKNVAAVLEAVNADGNIEKVIIAAWSDRDYPGTDEQTLNDKDRELADARATAVHAAVTDWGVKSVETVSMAETPSWLDKLLNNDAALFRGVGKISDANEKLASELGEVMRNKGGQGKAVVLIRRFGDQTSH